MITEFAEYVIHEEFRGPSVGELMQGAEMISGDGAFQIVPVQRWPSRGVFEKLFEEKSMHGNLLPMDVDDDVGRRLAWHVLFSDIGIRTGD